MKTYILIALLLALLAGTSAQDTLLTLSDALSGALDNNYGIRVSEYETEIAAINNHWGNAGRYPTVFFNASSSTGIDVNDPDKTVSNRVVGGLGARWTIFDGFRVNITKDKLEQLEDLSQGQAAVVIENAIQDIILGYYLVLLQMEKLKVFEKVMNLSADRYTYEQQKHELGGIATYRLLQAQNVYLSDKASHMNQEVLVRQSVRNLNFLMGEEPGRQWVYTEVFETDTVAYDEEDLLAKMLENNQNLRNQYAYLMLQENEIKLKKSALYPSLTMSAGIDNTFSQIIRKGSDPVNNTGIEPYGGISLSFDLFTGGTRKRAVEVARVSRDVLQTGREEMKHSLTNQLMNELDFYNLRIQLLVVNEESLKAANLNLQIAEEKFRTGVINSFNYRDIQLIYLNAAIQKLQSVYNLIDSRAVLTRLTGGFLSENEL